MTDIKEGDLYKTLTVEGVTFKILYGYYSQAEREHWGPTPIFPNFEKFPLFTATGTPFVTAEQDVCEYYSPKERVSGENWCNDCEHFELREEIIGVCRCCERKNKIRQNE